MRQHPEHYLRYHEGGVEYHTNRKRPIEILRHMAVTRTMRMPVPVVVRFVFHVQCWCLCVPNRPTRFSRVRVSQLASSIAIPTKMATTMDTITATAHHHFRR